MGAARVGTGGAEDLKLSPSEDVIVLVNEKGDKDGETISQRGHVCYGKDIIALSIFRGRLQTEHALLG